MKPLYLYLLLSVACTSVFSQEKLGPLTVEKIMRDPAWMGTQPSNPSWSVDGQTLYFNWNPSRVPSDSTYYITLANHNPMRASVMEKQNLMGSNAVTWNEARNAYTYVKDGDIFFADAKTGKTKRIEQTTDRESNPVFSFNDTRIVYTRNQNLFAWEITTGETVQLTNVSAAVNSTPPPVVNNSFQGNRGNRGLDVSASTAEEQWLKNDQMAYFEVLRTRKEKRDLADAYTKSLPRVKELRSIPIGDQNLQNLSISPDGRFISYRLVRSATNSKSTVIANYVTETGFTTDITGRSKVGSPQGSSDFYLYDREKDTIVAFKTDSIQGIRDLPDYVKFYPRQLEQRQKIQVLRSVFVSNISWSPKGSHAVLDIRSQDNKDRWLLSWDTASGKLGLLDRQRDEAWIGGPGVGFGANEGWLDEENFWFQSEATGYSHLYAVNVASGTKRTFTSGKFEVQDANLSRDRKYFYISTNEVHPGEQQFYRLSVASGRLERITTMTGANQVTISPDEKYLAILYSYSNKPWELYLQENKPGGKIIQVTDKAQSEEFKSYPWRDPEVTSFIARDGQPVYARIYKPANPAPGHPAVLFVHGAGYLQNAHKWWSSYFREYMFNNLLADNGYYVMDIDYRGSAGYGRDWRTGIYRHMGGKDLDDEVDAANYMVKNFGVDPTRIGLYGGSYGGFITLMALFTTPDVFYAGAALRPVTDWANYNHGYTANILNEPYNDSIAYHLSSPYYFAGGLKNHLLICHGMVDQNVHFQDAVKLVQRLIELGKNNWELAVYPVEDHGFVEPSSWTDEYKRIFKLFEENLKRPGR